jgi:hypothetical protein
MTQRFDIIFALYVPSKNLHYPSRSQHRHIFERLYIILKSFEQILTYCIIRTESF